VGGELGWGGRKEGGWEMDMIEVYYICMKIA
jgi:hypothetical protein